MSDILATVARVRRATRNADMLAVCDALEVALGRVRDLEKKLEPAKPVDRKTYMRLYMQKRREQDRTSKGTVS